MPEPITMKVALEGQDMDYDGHDITVTVGWGLSEPAVVGALKSFLEADPAVRVLYARRPDIQYLDVVPPYVEPAPEPEPEPTEPPVNPEA
ncbi:hypothetical protein HOS58_gp01 [Streptomyces phage Attoomi]|uniref:Uncharacterized protein n=1 Tax=Streptomyces phage Attoomi TaxID=2059881 RepID=A0A2H5BLF9_9CAUD|nr:hypothetical protein HOS58_gp01 [Streptomyces phage Attoomi]AUG87133.1 hypothetical protein SEA_ATTOOMI_1 [Streptomyces phage Attoomi]